MRHPAIIGTGLSGMVQAVALAHQGFAVTLVGPVPKPSADERTTAILKPGIDFLQQLGLWDAIKTSATKLAVMELIDRDQHIVFDAAEIGQKAFGYNIGNEALKQALTHTIATLDIDWHKENAAHFARSNDGWNITLASGKTLHTGLLIGADGAGSPTRTAAGIATDRKQVDQSAIVTILQAELPHDGTSVEWYLQGGPLTLVPMQKNRLAVVWCNQRAIQQEKLAATPARVERELNAITNGRFGTLRLDAPLQLWPVQPMKAQKLFAGQCVLVGEAAHVLAPIGAQGFNISLHDIMALTRILAQAKHAGLNAVTPMMLQRYEKTRLSEIGLRYHGVNTLNTLLQSRFPALHGLRRFSLLGIRTLPFIKKRLMHKGMTQKT